MREIRAFQTPGGRGTFIGSEAYPELNRLLGEYADKYGSTPTGIAAAWILRHPAKMQMLCGSMKKERVAEIVGASEITLTREEWYKLYLAAGHILP